MTIKKLHRTDELGLVMSSSIGPDVVGSSTNIGNVLKYKGLILKWRMDNRPEVFQQFIYLSDYDKSIIVGSIPKPANYPRRFTTVLSDATGTIMWLGVSLEGTRLYLSTNSVANPTLKLQRIFSFN